MRPTDSVSESVIVHAATKWSAGVGEQLVIIKNVVLHDRDRNYTNTIANRL